MEKRKRQIKGEVQAKTGIIAQSWVCCYRHDLDKEKKKKKKSSSSSSSSSAKKQKKGSDSLRRVRSEATARFACQIRSRLQ